MSRPGTDLAELENLLAEELTRLKNEPVADWELQKVQMQLRRQRAQQLYSTRRRANSLGHFAVFYDQPELINRVWRKYEDITKDDLRRVARAYLADSNRTVVTTLPKSPSGER
jgi:zinc protease